MEDRFKRRRLVAVGAFALAIGLVPACGGDDSSSTAASSAAATTGSTGDGGNVAVTLQEFAIAAAPASAPAGSVTFDVNNVGPNDVHEFVVIKTDLAPTELPVDDMGVVDEEGAGIEPVDEIEDIPVGDTPSLTVDLEAGNYVLICNIYSEDEQEAHYSEGMRIGFTVE
jgi:uncharacterized cupredoxin-like copper-binding protein